MSRLLNFTRTIAPLAILGVAVGCGGGDTGGEGGGGSAAPAEMPFDVSTAGNISGTVMFEGTAPPPEILDMASEASCAEQYDGDPTQSFVTVTDGQLANVFVYVKEGLEGMDFPVPAGSAVVDQSGCQYLPQVLGVVVNQPMTIRNSDGLLHNINASPTANRPFNISQPVNMETEREFAVPEIMVPIECDVHGWMSGYIGVVAHPYHSVTSATGSFDLSQLPPGEYLIEAWHSRLGTQEQTVTVTTGQTTEVSFTFSDAMASADVPLGEPFDSHEHGRSEDGTRRVGE